MRGYLIAMVVAGLPAGASAQHRTDAVRTTPVERVATIHVSHDVMLPPRDQPAAQAPFSYREYRVDPSFNGGRSAHGRALDEMNAINMRRPRPFRFRPVMAVTLNAADMDGPARMTGIAPSLMGARRSR